MVDHKTDSGVFKLGDSIEILRDLQPGKKILILTDPPWGHGKKLVKGESGKWSHLNTKHKKVEWNIIPGGEYFSIILKYPYICFGGNYLYGQLESGGEKFDVPSRVGMSQFIKVNPMNWIIWDKKKPEELLFSSFELIYTNLGIQTRVLNFVWNGLIQENRYIRTREKRIHPCQKPPALLMRIILDYVPEGTIIVDSFAGSCSLAIAVLKLVKLGFDYKYLCIEKDKDYYNDGVEWIQREQQKRSLFQNGAY